MFFFLSFLLACEHDNPLPIFTDTPDVMIKADVQEQRLKEVIAATKRTWSQGDKSKAQAIFQSYYVNEFNDLVPKFYSLGILGLADVQYEIGMFLIDIPIIEVPSKFESRLQEQGKSIQDILDQVPDKPLGKNEQR